LLFFHFDLNGGGAEKVLVELVNGLDKNKYDITVQTLFGVGKYINDFNTNIHFKYLFRKQFRGLSIILKMISPKLLHWLLIRDNYDVEIAYLENAPARIVGGCKKKGVKKIAWVHTTLQRMPKSFRSIKELKKCYHNFDKIVFLSEIAQNAFYKLTGEGNWPSAIIRNLIDSNKILQLSKERVTLRDDCKFRLIHLGRLAKVKGAARLLHILHNLKNKGICQWHLYYLGVGEEKRIIDEYIHTNNLQDYVTFLGFQHNPYKYLAKMDLLVCASIVEGYSTAAVEATLLEVPTITTNCSGMNEIFDNGKYGMIVDNTDIAIEQGLEKMICNPSVFDYYKSQLPERKSYFCYDTILKENEVFIDSVINS